MFDLDEKPLSDEELAKKEAEVNAAAAKEEEEASKKEEVITDDKKDETNTDDNKEDKTDDKVDDKKEEKKPNDPDELRAWSTKLAQENSSLNKKLTELADLVTKLNTPKEEKQEKRVIDPAEFLANPSKYVEDMVNQRTSQLKQEYEKQIIETNLNLQRDRVEREIDTFRKNNVSYPGFTELEPIMENMAKDPSCPVNPALPLAQRVDMYYKLAAHAFPDKVKMAGKVETKEEREAAQKKVEEERLKQEAAAGGGGKGKGGSSSGKQMTKDEFKKLSLADKEAWISNNYGVVER
jgi:hypothetical protein